MTKRDGWDFIRKLTIVAAGVGAIIFLADAVMLPILGDSLAKEYDCRYVTKAEHMDLLSDIRVIKNDVGWIKKELENERKVK